MTARIALTASALALACSHRSPAPHTSAAAPPGSSRTTPALVPATTAESFCPRDTEKVGDAPPGGGVVWCEDADGRKQGPYRSWYDSGQLEEEGQYRDGTKVGQWRYFDEQGELKGTKMFRQRVTVNFCVYEKATRRAVEHATLFVTNVETGDKTATTTKADGRGAAVVDSGHGRVEVFGPFPRFEVAVDFDGQVHPVRVALDAGAIQKILQRNMGRLTTTAACAR